MNKPLNTQYQRLILKEIYRRYTSEGNKTVTQKTTDLEDSVFHGTYGELLFDPRWKSKRLSILNRDEHRCVLCESKSGLQVHHRQYHYYKANKQFKPPWDYMDNLLITLCEKCHQKGHRQYKVPTVYI